MERIERIAVRHMRDVAPAREPTCEDKYYLCIIPTWRISIGWFEFFGIITSIVATYVSGFASLADISDYWKLRLGIAGIVLGCTATAFQILKSHAQKAIEERKNNLLDAIKFEEQVDAEMAPDNHPMQSVQVAPAQLVPPGHDNV